MSSTFAQDTANLPKVVTAYGSVDPSRRSPSFGGSLFAFADTVGGTPGSTAQHVDTYGLTAFVANNGRANVYPALDSAAVQPARGRADRGRRRDTASEPERVDLLELPGQRLPEPA